MLSLPLGVLALLYGFVMSAQQVHSTRDRTLTAITTAVLAASPTKVVMVIRVFAFSSYGSHAQFRCLPLSLTGIMVVAPDLVMTL